MFQIVDFLKLWEFEAAATQKLLNQLTDESLPQEVTSQNWTLGRIAWHTVTAIGIISSRIGLSFDAPTNDYPVPSSSEFISNSYQQASDALVQAVKNQLADKNLREELDIYGQKITKGELLFFLIQHQIHHRGQMTILMRQAGLSVPGLYGPSKEEWAEMGMEAPEM
ncbi:DinB family protein [Neobacillus rhizophilus]|uniref:DinB family protein n=1 Tax=Neobacillus rhizophilus TaxID=2833579 RepID=A0A942YXP1_9BACI|nr:DinB family protein [Neobacillus rhizophilus]MBS4214066.1 DinB family protein [Neobacillus rhizophilus]MBU8917532.1 DinB family protein [Bacillus sp. FJAT-29953]